MCKDETKIRQLQGQVGVLAGNIVQLLGAQNLEVVTETTTSVGRLNNIIDKASLSSHHGVGEAFSVLGSALFNVRAAVQNFDGTLGSHDGNFCTGPSVVDVSTQMLRRHDIIRTSVCLTGDDRYLYFQNFTKLVSVRVGGTANGSLHSFPLTFGTLACA